MDLYGHSLGLLLGSSITNLFPKYLHMLNKTITKIKYVSTSEPKVWMQTVPRGAAVKFVCAAIITVTISETLAMHSNL